ncbi:hypothetical protein Q31b_27220 [Novipirellula aureliae]|uniref:Uncharacterized protein n=1 Tax=Novipirellula aureliae TaxID=2527966 RepID=A0A5C6DV77_9BACT|nr:hypothetical protein [Novipirellula aureliae]TWU41283.1 hypothetical protein Q31b_27220 [Novipirellula aureliae]
MEARRLRVAPFFLLLCLKADQIKAGSDLEDEGFMKIGHTFLTKTHVSLGLGRLCGLDKMDSICGIEYSDSSSRSDFACLKVAQE